MKMRNSSLKTFSLINWKVDLSLGCLGGSPPAPPTVDEILI